MKVSTRLNSAALALSASIAVLSGCSGSQAPFTPAASAPQSLMPPNVSTPGEALYVASSTGCSFILHSTCHALVSVYSYPDGAYKGEWKESSGVDTTSRAGEACADNLGHVFVTYTAASGKILEFAHGGATPIATLGDPKGSPEACSVDAASGNLAVVTAMPDGSSTLLVYRNGSGRPAIAYSDARLTFTHVGYDNKGNAYVDGPTGLAVLRAGGDSFQSIPLDRKIVSFGSLQWDGNDIAITDIGADAIYRFAIKENAGGGLGGKLVGYTTLIDRSNGNRSQNLRFTQTWIANNNVVAADEAGGACDFKCAGSVNAWHYPQGGKAFKNIGGGRSFTNPSGVAVSVGL
ncbi:MAG: hypothetical protein JO078_13080 [Candidatus Eremiobacteraeota bacterium]|nr:hypothetical protein [Candidatus Eremiobacteraeota bacterium]MBV9055356.1 hypothetical protein [Candidatus Eremiobacteraeota bacterium]MBV9701036.1 hypothetical protein [Candidatus Eremiobacteraeota bacterium]